MLTQHMFNLMFLFQKTKNDLEQFVNQIYYTMLILPQCPKQETLRVSVGFESTEKSVAQSVAPL